MAKGSSRGNDSGSGTITAASLTSAIKVEEKARKELSSSMHGLRQEMQDFLTGRRPPTHLESLLGQEELQQMMDARLAGDAAPERVVPRFRPCACGCKAMVQCGEADWDSKVEPICLTTTSDPLFESRAVDPLAQRVSCERLAQSRHQSVDAAVEVQPCSGSKAQPDPARLERLALPRDEARRRLEESRGPPLPKLDLDGIKERHRPRPTAPASMARSSSTPSMQSNAAASSAGAASTPALVSSNGGSASGALKLSPLVLPQRRRKTLKLKPSGDDLPGLARLLEQATLDGPMSKTPPSKMSSNNGRPASMLVDMGGELPLWRNEAVRTAKAQQNYVEARLYRRPAEPVGTTVALQKRLADLQQQRREREEAAVAPHLLTEGEEAA